MTLLVNEPMTGTHGTNAVASNTTANSNDGLPSMLTFNTDKYVDGPSGIYINGVQNGTLAWTPATARADTLASLYFNLPVNPPADAFILGTRTGGGAVAAQCGFNSSGQLRIRNALLQVDTTAAGIILNQWYRMDWTISSTNSTQNLYLYTLGDLHSTNTADASEILTGAYSQGVQQEITFGSLIAVSGGWSCYADSLRVDDATMPAPAFVAATHLVGYWGLKAK